MVDWPRITVLAAQWPSSCVLCSARGQNAALDLCAACRHELPSNERACVRCAEPLTTNALMLCGRCLRRPPRFDMAHCALRYTYPVDSLIQRLKYGGAIAPARVLGELLGDCIRGRATSLPEIAIPVPLAQQRFQERGFNQAIEIGRIVAARLQIPLQLDQVIRVRDTSEQAGLERKQRHKNVRGAFVLSRPLSARHIAIIDDVVTTGSTVNEVARVLKRAGARRVEVWAVARAGRLGSG